MARRFGNKFWSKIESFVKNRNFGQKSKCCSKIDILVENKNFPKKSKFSTKIHANYLKLCSKDDEVNAKKVIHELKYQNISRIDDINIDKFRHTEFPDNIEATEGAAKTGISRNISLGFDENPYEDIEAKPVRIYYVSNQVKNQTSKSTIWYFDIVQNIEGIEFNIQ